MRSGHAPNSNAWNSISLAIASLGCNRTAPAAQAGPAEFRINIVLRISKNTAERAGEASNYNKGLVYAWKRHGGIGTWRGVQGAGAMTTKSQFIISGQDLESILLTAATRRVKVTKSAYNTNFVRVIDVGYTVGKTPAQLGAQPTNLITIVTDKFGNLVNVFPGGEFFEIQ